MLLLQLLPSPSYQTSAIASYLSLGTLLPGFGKGRGIPDVSPLGAEYTIASVVTSFPEEGGMVDNWHTVDLYSSKPMG